MKTCLSVILIFFINSAANAQIFVQTDLKIGMQYSGSYKSKSGGFFGIGEREETNNYTSSHEAHRGNGTYTENQTVVYKVAGIPTQNQSYDDFLEKWQPVVE